MITAISNYYVIDALTGTAGQPSAEQFGAVKAVGYEVVINLSMPSADRALHSEERRIITELGMTYAHIPIDFEHPNSIDFRIFAFVMDCFASKRVFIHCVANKRVAVFMFLYRIMRLHVSIQEAQRDLLAVWEPNEVWQRFIEKQLSVRDSRARY